LFKIISVASVAYTAMHDRSAKFISMISWNTSWCAFSSIGGCAGAVVAVGEAGACAVVLGGGSGDGDAGRPTEEADRELVGDGGKYASLLDCSISGLR
jgi:hypothetical protein